MMDPDTMDEKRVEIGRQQERADVVAWLMGEGAERYRSLYTAAECIQRGDHEGAASEVAE